MLVQQVVGNTAGANSAVAFTQYELWRCPAFVLCQILHNEFRDRLDVLIDTPEVFSLADTDRFREACTDRVNHHEIDFINDAVFVVDAFVRTVVRPACVSNDCALRSENTHV